MRARSQGYAAARGADLWDPQAPGRPPRPQGRQHHQSDWSQLVPPATSDNGPADRLAV